MNSRLYDDELRGSVTSGTSYIEGIKNDSAKLKAIEEEQKFGSVYNQGQQDGAAMALAQLNELYSTIMPQYADWAPPQPLTAGIGERRPVQRPQHDPYAEEEGLAMSNEYTPYQY